MPRVVDVQPPPGGDVRALAGDALVTITFSAPMDREATEQALSTIPERLAGAWRWQGVLAWSDDSREMRLSFDPQRPERMLAPGQRVTLRIGSGARSAGGLPLDGAFTTTFRMKASTIPEATARATALDELRACAEPIDPVAEYVSPLLRIDESRLHPSYWMMTRWRAGHVCRVYVQADGLAALKCSDLVAPTGDVSVGCVVFDGGDSLRGAMLRDSWPMLVAGAQDAFDRAARQAGLDHAPLRLRSEIVEMSGSRLPRLDRELAGMLLCDRFPTADWDVVIGLDLRSEGRHGTLVSGFIPMGDLATDSGEPAQLAAELGFPELMGLVLLQHQLLHQFGWEHGWAGDVPGQQRGDLRPDVRAWPWFASEQACHAAGTTPDRPPFG